MILTGCDRLLREPRRLAGRRYGLLAHPASVTSDLRPLHMALSASAAGPPAALFGPEHGFYGVEQDMVPAEDARDPWTELPIRSLYAADEASLRPLPAAFDGLDLLVVDLQDVGARYYTYAATAVWAAEAALAAGCEVWVLDRPNPLGAPIEGNLRQPAYESFVGAFKTPVRHGLTLGEVVLLEARRRGWPREGLSVWAVEGWEPALGWGDRPFVAPSPNLPTLDIAWLYPGACLVEGTEVSEGRGTTRPFRLVGAPWVEPRSLAGRLAARRLPGLAFVPTWFRPQFHKHAGEVCGGVEMVVTDPAALAPFRSGCELIFALREEDPERFAWRQRPYEFVADRPAVDLLAGSEALRRAVDAGDRVALEAWMGTWPAEEREFRAECEEVHLYPRRGR